LEAWIVVEGDELHAARTPGVARTKTKEARMRRPQAEVVPHVYAETYAATVKRRTTGQSRCT